MMELKLVTTNHEFDNLESDWKNLVNINHDISVFQSWEWQKTWWLHYGNNQSLHIIVAYNDSQVVGVFPLYVQKKKFLKFIEIDLLRFIGTGGDTSPDDLGVLIDPEYAEEVLEKVSNFLIKKSTNWDVVSLTEISSNDLLISIIKKSMNRYGFKYNIKSHAIIQYIDLPDTWAEYLATKSKKSRKTFRHIPNVFKKLNGFKFYLWADNKNLNTVFDRLVELHHMRWEGRARQYSFRTNEYRDFHRAVIGSLFDKDAIRLYCMEVNDEIMAIEYCYKWNNKIFNFQGGFDPFYEMKSPGKAIFIFMIEHAINEGNHIFDMLKGDYAYKKSLSNNERETMSITVYQKNIKGFLYRMRFKHISNIKKIISRVQ